MVVPLKLLSLLFAAQLMTAGDFYDFLIINKPAKMEQQILQIKKDSTTLIKFKSLSTAGYVWNYSIDDSLVVKIEKKDTEFPAMPPKRVGDSGLEVFAVTGLKKGTAKIVFEQKRPWNNGGGPVKIKNYTVRVEE